MGVGKGVKSVAAAGRRTWAKWRNLSLPLGVCFCAGLLLVLLGARIGGGGLALAGAGCGIGIFWWRIRLRREWRGAWSAAALGMMCAAVAWGWDRAGSAGDLNSLLEQRTRAASVIAVCDDAQLSTRWDSTAGRGVIAARVEALQWPGESQWQAAKGTILLLTRGVTQTQSPVVFQSGTRYQLTGTLHGAPRLGDRFLGLHREGAPTLESAPLPDTFPAYLAARNHAVPMTVRQAVEVDSSAFPLPESTWARRMREAREAILNLLLSHIEPPRNQALLAAIFCGSRRGVEAEIRNQFTAVGVVHLFSVSGLHVGAMAGVLLLLLRGIGLRARWPWLGLLALYVAATGGNAPAIRAFLMILALAFFQGNLLLTRGTELLALLAGGLLLYQPNWLFEPGFQYSFLITGALLGAASHCRAWGRLARAEFELLPPTARNWRGRLWTWGKVRAGQAVLIAVVAAAAGGALSLYYQGVFYPGTIFVNLLLLPLMGVLFPLAALKIVFAGCAWNWANQWAATILNGVLNVLTGAVDWAAEQRYDWNFVPPSGWGIVLFGVALTWFLAARTRWQVLTAALLCAGWFAWLHELPTWRADRWYVGIGGSLTQPVMVHCRSALGAMLVLNPGRGAGTALGAIARANGITVIDGAWLTQGNLSCGDGLPDLAAQFPVRKVGCMARNLRSSRVRALLDDFPRAYGTPPDARLPNQLWADGEFAYADDGGWRIFSTSGEVRILRSEWGPLVIQEPDGFIHTLPVGSPAAWYELVL